MYSVDWYRCDVFNITSIPILVVVNGVSLARKFESTQYEQEYGLFSIGLQITFGFGSLATLKEDAINSNYHYIYPPTDVVELYDNKVEPARTIMYFMIIWVIEDVVSGGSSSSGQWDCCNSPGWLHLVVIQLYYVCRRKCVMII
jgi:hypothetical protein